MKISIALVCLAAVGLSFTLLKTRSTADEDSIPSSPRPLRAEASDSSGGPLELSSLDDSTERTEADNSRVDPSDALKPDPDSHPAPSGVSVGGQNPYSVLSTEALRALKNDLGSQLEQLKGEAVVEQWNRGEIHIIEGKPKGDGMTEFTFSELTDEGLFRGHRFSGGSSEAEEVRLQKEEYPDIYDLKEQYDLASAEYYQRSH